MGMLAAQGVSPVNDADAFSQRLSPRQDIAPPVHVTTPWEVLGGRNIDAEIASVTTERNRNEFISPARPTLQRLNYYLRRFPEVGGRWFGWHGVVRDPPERVLEAQSSQRMNPRIERSAPAVPWDYGTALTSSGLPEGL